MRAPTIAWDGTAHMGFSTTLAVTQYRRRILRSGNEKHCGEWRFVCVDSGNTCIDRIDSRICSHSASVVLPIYVGETPPRSAACRGPAQFRSVLFGTKSPLHQ